MSYSKPLCEATLKFSAQIRADGYCEGASGVVSLARNLMVDPHAY